MKDETAGDPMTGLLWTRKTRKKISDELAKVGIVVCPTTVGKILKQLKYSLKSNSKKVANGGRKLTKEEKKAANEQFEYIAEMRKIFTQKGYPIMSCDTKKKELIGNFKNPGTRYRKEADLVNDHDFINYALGKIIPYGLYDVVRNEGFVYVFEALWDKKNKKFSSTETPELATEAVARWWKNYGQRRYPKSNKLLLLVDSGGSNGYRPRMWKLKLFDDVANKLGLTVTVCHYPPRLDHRRCKIIGMRYLPQDEIGKEVSKGKLAEFSRPGSYMDTARGYTFDTGAGNIIYQCQTLLLSKYYHRSLERNIQRLVSNLAFRNYILFDSICERQK